MHVVAVRALNQSLRNLVVEGQGELLLDVVVALVAQLRLRRLQEMRRCFGSMDAVAARAAHVGFDVGGTIDARMISVMT